MAERRWLAVLVVCTAPVVRGADEVGADRQVVVKRAGVTFGFVEDGKWVSAGEVTEVVVTVQECRGDWALIRSGGKRGWVHTREVVPLADAAAFFTGLIEAQPRTGAHYLRRAAAWAEQGEHAKADRDWTEAIRLIPKDPAAHYGRAVTRHLSKEYTGALEDYGSVIRLDPNHAGAFAGRAWLRATCSEEKHRDGAEAVRDARRACELTEWGDPNCIDNLAAALAESGRFDEAVRWQSKALEFPTFAGRSRENALARVKLYKNGKPYRTEGRE